MLDFMDTDINSTVLSALSITIKNKTSLIGYIMEIEYNKNQ